MRVSEARHTAAPDTGAGLGRSAEWWTVPSQGEEEEESQIFGFFCFFVFLSPLGIMVAVV